MGVVVHHLRLEPNFNHRVGDALAPISTIEAVFVHGQPFFDNLQRRHSRREGAEGILEDNLYAPSQSAQLGSARGAQIALLEADLTTAGDEAQRRQGETRLSGTRLTHDADGATGSQAQGHTVDGSHEVTSPPEESALKGEVDFELHELEGRRRRFPHRLRCCTTRQLGVDELTSVRMLWRGQDGLGSAALDDDTLSHDADAVGEPMDDGQVVSDKEDSHGGALSQFGE